VLVVADSPVVGKDLGELNVRGKSGATVIAVIRDSNTKVSPGANYKLRAGDIVVLVGSPEKLERGKDLLIGEDDIGGFNP
jgi:K+/H+ antiporter YhaU regulatory subunit KhtT